LRRVHVSRSAQREGAKPALAGRRDGIDAPVFEEPEIEAAGPEDDDPLYDSTRDYLDQLERYKSGGEQNE
jgi:hypothetical protein